MNGCSRTVTLDGSRKRDVSGIGCVCGKLGCIPGSKSHTWGGRIPPLLCANCSGGILVPLSAFFLHLLFFSFFFTIGEYASLLIV